MIVRQPQLDLKSKFGRVEKSQINIIKKDAGTAAEREHSILVGERVKAVMVAFDDLEWSMQGHPIEQIGKLAQAAADTANDLSARELHSLAISFFGVCFAQLLPKRKCLAWFDQDTVDRRARYLEILNLIVLQLRVRITKFSPEQGLVSLT